MPMGPSDRPRGGYLLLALGALALGAVCLLWWLSQPPSDGSGAPNGGAEGPAPEHRPRPDPLPSQEDGKQPGPPQRKIMACFLTRKGATPYQYTLRHDKVSLPFQQLPGWEMVADALAYKGKQVPATAYRVDQFTESLLDNLGLPTRSMVSYFAYLNPYDGQVLAYELAMTSGGVPQLLRGHLTRKGIQIQAWRGGLETDNNEIPFPRETSILPVELEFLHQWYRQNPDHKAQVQWLFFVPEVMGFIRLIVYPPRYETISHRGSQRECAVYEVFASSTKAVEGVFAQQRLWFDLQRGELLQRLDLEPGLDGSLQARTERLEPEALAPLLPLVIRPPAFAQRPFPYPLDRTLVYRVSSREKELGKIRIRYSRQPADAEGPAGYLARAVVEMDMPNSYRKEEALTRFDEAFRPLNYSAKGEEAAESVAAYSLETRFQKGAVEFRLDRSIQDRPTPAPQDPASSEPKRSAQVPPSQPQEAPQEQAAPPAPPAPPPQEASPPGQERYPAPAEDGWRPPLRLISLQRDQEREREAAKPRLRSGVVNRPLSAGTLVYDFNRVEHLAVAAFRFPLPDQARVVAGQPQVAYQSAGFFLVRRNQAGVVLFTIVPEPAAEGARDPADADPERPNAATQPLYLAWVTAALMPCSLLLDRDGRLLQLTSRYGQGEIVYTLEDPLMRARQERNKKLPGQEGPILLRPPWY